MSKPWKEMNRDELLDERSKWESNLQKTNLELNSKRRAAAATGKYSDSSEYEALMKDRLRYASGLRGVTTQLSKVNALSANSSFDAAFRKVAKLILDEDLFDEICEGARSMLSPSVEEALK